MGKRGSEVSREAADLILMDDNFTTIVETVRDGRRIYDNIRKAVGYVFTIHIPIAFASLLAPFLGIAPAALLLTEECTRTVYAVQLLPPFVWEDPLPPLPDAPAALSLTLTMRDVEEIDACPAALGHRLACDKAGKRWLHHPRAETYLSERVALFQQLYR